MFHFIKAMSHRLWTKLVVGTHHDRFHMHKVLGFGALAHFMIRWMWWWMYGTMGWSNSALDLWVVVWHMALSLSSFLFPVRVDRNPSHQIIWKELQLHNIVFSARSCAIFAYVTLFPGQTSPWIRMALVLLHHLAADWVTHHYGRGYTMRDMAWDRSFLSPIAQHFYCLSQIGAVSALVFGDYPREHALLILFGIQISTFLMTLRLKGIISNDMWHLVYSLVLLMSWTLAKDVHHTQKTIIISFYILRILSKANKYFAWLFILALHQVLSLATASSRSASL